jgi:hypothetical protein
VRAGAHAWRAIAGLGRRAVQQGAAARPSGLEEQHARIDASPAPVQGQDLLGRQLRGRSQDEHVRELDLSRGAELRGPTGDVPRHR